jgi:hypothetical protein
MHLPGRWVTCRFPPRDAPLSAAVWPAMAPSGRPAGPRDHRAAVISITARGSETTLLLVVLGSPGCIAADAAVDLEPEGLGCWWRS